jgi:hypothetical protein
MAKVAKAEPHTKIAIAGQQFDFGEDGTRQVSNAEVDLLTRYADEGGTATVEIEEQTASSKKKEAK